MFRPEKRKKFINSDHIGQYVDIRFSVQDLQHVSGQQPEENVLETPIHYLEKGKGEPLILVHGIGQSLFTWRKSIHHLSANGFRVIAPDLIGYGYSGRPDVFYTVEDNAGALSAFLDALHIKKASFCAFSEGAAYLLRFAVDHPDRVDRMILITPGGPNEYYPLAVRMLATVAGKTLLSLFFRESTVRRLLLDSYFDKTLIDDHTVREYFMPLDNPVTKSVLLRSVSNYDDSRVLERLRELDHKTLILWGTDDAFHPREIVDMYHSPFKNAHLMPVRNCSYLLHEEKSERFNKVSVDFLRWKG